MPEQVIDTPPLKSNHMLWETDFIMSPTFIEFISLIPEAVILSDREGRVLLTNLVAQQLFQYQSEEFTQHVIEDLVPESVRSQHGKMRAWFFENPKPRHLQSRTFELKAVKKDGSIFPMESALFAMQTDQGLIAVNLIHDVSEQQANQAEIAESAFFDALTHLPNRRLFEFTLQKKLARAKRHQQKMAFFFIDLDRFKPINDHEGHKVGDMVLCEIAKRLSEAIRAEDFLARIGGDEFIIMICPVSDEHFLDELAHRVLASCAAPIIVEGKSFTISVSIGVSISKNQKGDFDGKALVHEADKAMYLAKRAGGNCYAIDEVVLK